VSALDRAADRKAMRTMSEQMKRRVRAQRRAREETSPPLWGYYHPCVVRHVRSPDLEVAFRANVELDIYDLKAKISRNDLRSAVRAAVNLYRLLCEEEEKSQPSNVVDLVAYKRGLAEHGGGPTS
jgi:hypothetical protein